MAKKLLSGKDNTNGFQKNPQNINKTGANAKSITASMKELLAGDYVSFEIILTNEDGEEKITKGSIKSKDTLNQLLATILIQKAIGGDLNAIKEVLSRCEGAPDQKIIINDENEIPSHLANLSAEDLRKMVLLAVTDE